MSLLWCRGVVHPIRSGRDELCIDGRHTTGLGELRVMGGHATRSGKLCVECAHATWSEMVELGV